MKNLLLLLSVVTLSFGNMFAQVSLNNFETEADMTDVVAAGGATVTWADNPDNTGINATNKCLQVGREVGNTTWWALFDMPVDFTLTAGTTKYLQVMMKFPSQPDISLRLNSDGNGSDIRPSINYSNDNAGKWQIIEFTLTGDRAINNLRFLVDIGYENVPAGQVLGGTGNVVGFLDEITISDISTDFEAKVEVKDYMLTCVNGVISLSMNEPKKVAIYDSVGSLVKMYNTSKFNYTAPGSGLYILKIGNNTEKVIVR